MPTKISYNKNWEEKRKFLSYCVESPAEVFRQVYLNNRIMSYLGIETPIDASHNEDGNWHYDNGLIIQKVSAPAGTLIVGKLEDVNLTQAKTQIEPRNLRDMKENFRRAAYGAMQYMPEGEAFAKPADYLDIYELRKREGDTLPKLQRKLEGLLEIAEVVFNFKNPSVEDLKRFLER